MVSVTRRDINTPVNNNNNNNNNYTPQEYKPNTQPLPTKQQTPPTQFGQNKKKRLTIKIPTSQTIQTQTVVLPLVSSPNSSANNTSPNSRNLSNPDSTQNKLKNEIHYSKDVVA